LSIEKKCYLCGSTKKVSSTFGKLKCYECIQKSKTGIKGHSGMIYNKSTSIQFDMFSEVLTLMPIKKSNDLFVKWYMEHYPNSKGIVGRSLNYLIYINNEPIGIIGGASPPLNYKLFRKYFDTDDEKKFINNNVFRIVNNKNKKNLGTQILKLYRNTIKKDYEKKYQDILLGIITFVEPPRTGAIYKADNWENLGFTQGISVSRRGENWYDKKYQQGTKKLIYGYKY